MRTICPFLLLLLFSLGLSACVTMSDPEGSQDYRAAMVAEIKPGQSVGQTFISRRAGLNSVQVWLRVTSMNKDGQLQISLFHKPGEADPLVSSRISLSQVQSTGSATFSFPALPGPDGQAYYLRLETQDGTVLALGRDEDAYADGQALVNDAPADADLSFRLSYDYGLAAILDDIRRVLSGAWLIIPLLILLWLPGFVLLDLAGLRWRYPGWEGTALSLGLSMSIIPVLMTWTTSLGLHWSPAAAWIAAGLLTVIALWRNRTSLIGLGSGDRRSWLAAWSWSGSALAAVLLFTLGVRLAMVRDLAAPPWVDSIHHGMIARLIAERGAFPASYAPYLDIRTASYHAGFHALVAVFMWFSGLDVAWALLLLGQVLNALACLAVYLFTVDLTRSRGAGVAAALAAGLCTPMPAYFTSWGRYTELAGLLILPAAAVFIQALVESARLPESTAPGSFPPQVSPLSRLSLLLLAAVTCGGLFLTHYRVIVFLACLLVARFLPEMARSLQRGVFRRTTLRQVGWIAAGAGLATLLTLPWWPPTISTLFVPALGSPGNTALFADFSWAYLNTALGNYVMALSALGLLLALFQLPSLTFTLLAWTGLLFLAANLGYFHLPGSTFINNTSVEISLFLPLAAAAGYLIGWLAQAWSAVFEKHGKFLLRLALAVAGGAVAITGARQLLPLLNPTTFLFREADRSALAWIEANIPASETLAVNGFAWGYGLYSGNDGGAWMVPLAERRSLPPPVLYAFDNLNGKADKISAASSRAITLSDQPEALHDFLLSQGIHYLYAGARGGAFSPKMLKASPLFELLFAHQGTWVFQVK